jgi:hypothetical protein
LPSCPSLQTIHNQKTTSTPHVPTQPLFRKTKYGPKGYD